MSTLDLARGDPAPAPAPKPGVGSTATAPDDDPAVKPLGKAKPTGLKIPSTGVNTTKTAGLSVDAGGEPGVPDADTEADVPGWWTGGVTPGEKGVSVLLAHYDIKPRPGPDEGRERDRTRRPRGNPESGRHHTAVFRIHEIEDVRKEAFPTQKVHGPTARPELGLLTCGGGLENGHRTTGNVILYATLAA